MQDALVGLHGFRIGINVYQAVLTQIAACTGKGKLDLRDQKE